jgi:hypothetical protein
VEFSPESHNPLELIKASPPARTAERIPSDAKVTFSVFTPIESKAIWPKRNGVKKVSRMLKVELRIPGFFIVGLVFNRLERKEAKTLLHFK